MDLEKMTMELNIHVKWIMKNTLSIDFLWSSCHNEDYIDFIKCIILSNIFWNKMVWVQVLQQIRHLKIWFSINSFLYTLWAAHYLYLIVY